MKYIVITGGVISGLGKGITASSIGLLLKSRGLNVTAIKIDPYLNVDAGTMSPYEHGECYVLADGGEGDLDLGNYERFLDIDLTKDHNITTGKIYQSVINKERNGDYLGKTVQIIPHITNEIQEWIERVTQIKVNNNFENDVCIIELGGTIGDMETAPYIEALRQLSFKVGKHNLCFVHVSLIVNNGEPKTKPTQQNIATLRSLGIIPNILVLRTDSIVSDEIKQKLNMFCHVDPDNIISNINVPNIYYVPQTFKDQQVCEKIGKILALNFPMKYEINKSFIDYTNVINYFNKRENCEIVKVLIAGKYTGSQDTYLSLIRAVEHAAIYTDIYVHINWLDTETIEDHNIDVSNKLKEYHCIIIPGGFGHRGTEGKIKVATYARKNNIPLLGICLGMQVMVIEYAQHIGIKNATSLEWDNKLEGSNIIDILPNQTGIKGGTMRLGNYQTFLDNKSFVREIYGKNEIIERHRHRYEVNNTFVDILEQNGLRFSGKSNNNSLMEIIELDKNDFYIGCQFHPEYKSRYNVPHPLFVGLLKYAKK